MSEDVLYTLQDCGCLALVLADDPRTLADCADDVAEQLRQGRTIHRTDVDLFRAGNPPLRCRAHTREAAERASLIPVTVELAGEAATLPPTETQP